MGRIPILVILENKKPKHAMNNNNSTEDITDEEMKKRGELLAEVLGIPKRKGSVPYMTTWGSKTALGLFLTVRRIIESGEQ